MVALMGGPPSWLHPSRGRDPVRPGRSPNDIARTAPCEDVPMIEIGSFRPGDRAAWEALARGYKAFYADPVPDEAYEQTWRRLTAGTELRGLGARLDGRLAGLAHYFFHP